MAVTPYRVTPARIGNSSGLRLPAAFFTLLLRLEPPEQQQSEVEDDSLMLGLFLDFLSRQALTSDQGPVLYNQAKEGDRHDGYAVFSRLVQRGELPENWASLERALSAD